MGDVSGVGGLPARVIGTAAGAKEVMALYSGLGCCLGFSSFVAVVVVMGGDYPGGEVEF